MRNLNSFTVSKKGGSLKESKKSFGMAFYLMLEALDALKMKYWVHMVKVHNAQIVDRSRWTDEKKLATVRIGFFFENAGQKFRPIYLISRISHRHKQ